MLSLLFLLFLSLAPRPRRPRRGLLGDGWAAATWTEYWRKGAGSVGATPLPAVPLSLLLSLWL